MGEGPLSLPMWLLSIVVVVTIAIVIVIIIIMLNAFVVRS